jgi:hypothetical protein
MVDIVLPVLGCQKCGWKWTPRKSSRPAMCPHCGSRKWEPKDTAGDGPKQEWKGPTRREGESLWAWIARLGDSLPEEEKASMPTDGAINHDYYLYGSPKVG